MVLCSMAGLTVGAAMALRKGLPVIRTSLVMGANCAMVGTACFGLERVSNIALRQVMNDKENKNNRLYLSHAIGGATGGGLVGSLFQFRVFPGIAAFTPLMLMVAYGEIKFEEARSARIAELLQEIESEQNS
jgi:hypothetical protein